MAIDQISPSGLPSAIAPNPNDLVIVDQIVSGQYKVGKAPLQNVIGANTQNVGSASGVLTLNYASGPMPLMTVTENINTITLTNTPNAGFWSMRLVMQIGGAGGYTCIFPPAWYAADGGAKPTISRTVGVIDIFEIFGFGAGNIYIRAIGQNFVAGD